MALSAVNEAAGHKGKKDLRICQIYFPVTCP
jgi:hypothetical protein